MNFEAIKERAERARESSTEKDGRTFRWRAPTEGEMRRIALRGPRAASVGAHGHEICAAALIGWSGVTVGDILPDEPDAADPIEFSLEAAYLLLDVRVDLCDLLTVEILKAFQAHKQRLEDQRKKPRAASNGN